MAAGPKPEQETPKFRSPEEILVGKKSLADILKAHKEWLETDHEYGKQAVLTRADLSWADLSGVNLQVAVLEKTLLWGAKLEKADLESADLQGADLREANLKGANLSGANLRAANFTNADLLQSNLRQSKLQDTDISQVRGLLATQLGGANVSNAQLPPAIAEFKGLEFLEKLSQNARRHFVIILLGSAYAFVTIASTTDANLLTNAPAALLPNVSVPIPTAGFYLVAPPLLFILYLYFHFHMQRIWDVIADLPAIFPDGRPVDKVAYPWLPNTLARLYSGLLKETRPPPSRLETLILMMVIWWVVPISLLLFWLRYLPLQDPGGTALQVLVCALSVGTAWRFRRLAENTISGGAFAGPEKHPRWMRRFGSFALVASTFRASGLKPIAMTSIVLAALSVFSIGAINGVPRVLPGQDRAPEESGGWQRWVPAALARIPIFEVSPFANLKEAEISGKPADWTEEKGIRLVTGAELEGRSLRYARAESVFLVNAHLEDADLTGANFWAADFRGARLRRANLGQALLVGADLREADLKEANLAEADLSSADLSGADLERAILERAVLLGVANLARADLSNANLELADLGLSDDSEGNPQQPANLREAKLQNASLKMAILQGADLTGADLTAANLREADLQGAILADLEGANLRAANLRDADLRGANLRGAKVTTNQVEQAKNHNLAFYDKEFLEQLGWAGDHNDTVKNKLEQLREDEKLDGNE